MKPLGSRAFALGVVGQVGFAGIDDVVFQSGRSKFTHMEHRPAKALAERVAELILRESIHSSPK
jgi:hypothetical protein